MSKFVMECPYCGRYVEASNFIFAKKKIDCVCGYTIDVRADKLKSVECAHCGNTVMIDQSKAEKAVCPVCHEPINTAVDMHRLAEFSCPSCSCKLTADKAAEKYKLADEALASLRDAKITDHRQIRDGVYSTEYNNSSVIYFNYNDTEETVNSVKVAPKSFIRVG